MSPRSRIASPIRSFHDFESKRKREAVGNSSLLGEDAIAHIAWPARPSRPSTRPPGPSRRDGRPTDPARCEDPGARMPCSRERFSANSSRCHLQKLLGRSHTCGDIVVSRAGESAVDRECGIVSLADRPSWLSEDPEGLADLRGQRPRAPGAPVVGCPSYPKNCFVSIAATTPGARSPNRRTASVEVAIPTEHADRQNLSVRDSSDRRTDSSRASRRAQPATGPCRLVWREGSWKPRPRSRGIYRKRVDSRVSDVSCPPRSATVEICTNVANTYGGVRLRPHFGWSRSRNVIEPTGVRAQRSHGANSDELA